MQASTETLDALAAENRQYEKRFGHVFLIAASGRSGDEILGELRRRMSNDPASELAEATSELRTIVQVRLARMLSE
jgi:2-oxo-4-hydroxy-4-carboxy-5-ureidoimidazoline decarboxylase